MKTGCQIFGLCCLTAMLSGTAWSADPAFQTTHFSGSANCAFCHNGLTDGQGNDVSIEKD